MITAHMKKKSNNLHHKMKIQRNNQIERERKCMGVSCFGKKNSVKLPYHHKAIGKYLGTFSVYQEKKTEQRRKQQQQQRELRVCNCSVCMWWISLKAKENMTFRNYSAWIVFTMFMYSVVHRENERDNAKDMMFKLCAKSFGRISVIRPIYFSLLLSF